MCYRGLACGCVPCECECEEGEFAAGDSAEIVVYEGIDLLKLMEDYDFRVSTQQAAERC